MLRRPFRWLWRASWGRAGPNRRKTALGYQPAPGSPRKNPSKMPLASRRWEIYNHCVLLLDTYFSRAQRNECSFWNHAVGVWKVPHLQYFSEPRF